MIDPSGGVETCTEVRLKFSQPRNVVVLIVAALVLSGAWLIVRAMQGPLLSAYRLQAQPLVQTVVATGRVASASRAQVGTQIAGVISERRIREGEEVKAGDVLAVLQGDDYRARLREAEAALADIQQSAKPQAEAALRRARTFYRQASRESTRRRELFAQQLVSREMMEQSAQAEASARATLEQAELSVSSLSTGHPGASVAQARVAAASAALEKTFIRAQVDGTVLTRNAEPGDVVQPGQVLFEIAREGETELVVPVDEKNLSVLALNQSAMCVADAYPDRPFPAAVSFIAPAVDPKRGSVDIRLHLDPVPDFLRQDMTVSVNVETGRRDSAVVIPNDALDRSRAGRPTVWKVVGGRAFQTRVTLGLQGTVVTEVLDGLAEGDLVLSASDATIADGGRVRTRVQSLSPEPPDRTTDREVRVKFN